MVVYMCQSKLWELGVDRKAWCAAVHRATKSRTPLTKQLNQTELIMSMLLSQFIPPSPSAAVSMSPFSMSASPWLNSIPLCVCVCVRIYHTFFIYSSQALFPFKINLFILIGGLLLYSIVVVFAIHRHESAMGAHVSP